MSGFSRVVDSSKPCQEKQTLSPYVRELGMWFIAAFEKQRRIQKFAL